MDIYSKTSEVQHLEHHGVKGQKWGVRRYQNYDGTLTAKGKKRYRNRTESDTDFIYRPSKEMTKDILTARNPFQHPLRREEAYKRITKELMTRIGDQPSNALLSDKRLKFYEGVTEQAVSYLNMFDLNEIWKDSKWR